MSHIIKNYNKLFINNLPIRTSDYVNEYIIKIHDELYNNALNKYAKEKSVVLDLYKIIEMKDENYLYPSKVMLISKQDFEKQIVDLTPYWNTNYSKYNFTSIFNELLISDENKKNIEIEEINYPKGKITFKNKFNNKKFTVDIDKIDFNPIYKNKLENTFSYMLKNI